MFLMRFTERAYVAYTEEDVRNSFRSSVRLTFPNSHFNPGLGADHVQTSISTSTSTRTRSALTA